jgi:hypothetical protein
MNGNSWWAKGLEIVVFLLLAIVLSGVGLWACSWSFSKIHHMRQLERVPRAQVSAVISGEVNLSGRVAPDTELLESPDTHTRSVYYRYHVEREKIDPDGDTYWSTVKNVHRSVNFKLTDASGEILLRPSESVDFDVGLDSQRISGSMRYTEYVLEPGSKVFVFGYANSAGAKDKIGRYSVDFSTPGSYLPIISENSAKGERQDMALWSALALLGGVAALSFAVVFLLGVFRVHHSAFYLFSVTSVMVGVLAFQGLSMMKSDLEDADKRAHRALDEAGKVVSETVDGARIEWSGDWGSLGSFDDQEYAALDPQQRVRLRQVRLSLAQSVERTNANLERFPESLLGPIWGVHRLESLPLPPSDQQELARLEQNQEATRINIFIALFGLITGAIGTLLASRLGLKKVSTKRTIENVPTSPIQGVAYGLCEIKGTVELDESRPVLGAPISQFECVYYRLIVKEKDSDGDWHTVSDKERSVSFYCRDQSGRMFVDRDGARFMAKETRTTRSGNTKNIESRITPGEPLYALGSAEIDPDTHDKLQLTEGHGELPFILSTYPEKTVMYKEARTSFYLFNAGLIAAVLAALGLVGTLGTFGPMLYTTAAAFACGFLFVMLFFLYYNDLIFLRERVERNWSNIDVALKKRFDLISGLENTVKGYLAHESELQEALAQARAARQRPSKQIAPTSDPGAPPADDPFNDQALSAEAHVRNQVVATIEAYPDLKGQQVVVGLMNNLTDIENEIALMRDGYNDAVERSNTRQLKFPEVVIAKMFGFKTSSHFRTFGDQREAPAVADRQAATIE